MILVTTMPLQHSRLSFPRAYLAREESRNQRPGEPKRSGWPLATALNEMKGLGMRVPSLALRTAQSERRSARQPRARMTSGNQ